MAHIKLPIALGVFLALTIPAVAADDVKETGAIESQTPTATSRKQQGDKAQAQAQPQGRSGPTETKEGGTRADDPQGETPAGMQVDGKKPDGVTR